MSSISKVPSVAIAIRSTSGGQPSPQQMASILQTLGPELIRHGFSLAPNRDVADFVASVRFTPDPSGRGGHVDVTSMEPSAGFNVSRASADPDEVRELRQRQRDFEQWVNLHPIGLRP